MFLVSDALTFGGLLTAYGFARHSAPSWPIGEETFNAMPFLGSGYPLLYVALMTFILIVSFRAKRGYYSSENTAGLKAVGVFWHFVGLLWLYLYVFLEYIN